MNPMRAAIWLAGLAAIVAGAALLYFEAGLARWVPIGFLVAGLLVFVGLAVMAFAGRAPSEPRPDVRPAREAARGPSVTIVEAAPVPEARDVPRSPGRHR